MTLIPLRSRQRKVGDYPEPVCMGTANTVGLGMGKPNIVRLRTSLKCTPSGCHWSIELLPLRFPSDVSSIIWLQPIVNGRSKRHFELATSCKILSCTPAINQWQQHTSPPFDISLPVVPFGFLP